ncbi:MULTISPECIES: glycosyltransferase [unclassified Moorena]|uniref:glycosyltransferase n=1 Tax=unclassified Moorena TaxID=2683338 RepID=UPI0013FF3CC3|nr:MULTISPECIES: glycosyltransferase [unclassified Moorena]NEO14141.1 glycosyl transferase [Moorena sp. SIO3E8]NEQ00653.1 glycosyl transferase [Moorena sp. SIO3F7]
MKNKEPVRVFIGSGEASLVERKVSIYSLRKHSRRELDIYVFNGTHNAIERNDDQPYLAPMSLRVKYRNTTEFSLYRYLIPQLCNYQGKAIYIDSDTICLTDIGELFDTPLDGCDFLAKRAYSTEAKDLWGLSVMLIDCQKCNFDLETYYNEIEQGLYSYPDLARMSPAFLAHHHYQIGELNPLWNVFDYYDKDTKLIHYTNLYTQPWKSHNHPYGDLWFQYFNEARECGYISENDIDLSFARSYVRRDLLKGNFSGSFLKKVRYTPLIYRLYESLKKLLIN